MKPTLIVTEFLQRVNLFGNVPEYGTVTGQTTPRRDEIEVLKTPEVFPF